MKKILLLFLLLFIMNSKNCYAKFYSGLWVECEGSEGTLTSKEKIDELIADAEDMGINILFIQVHRGNRAWLNSSYADKTPYLEFKKKYGVDLTDYIIQKAKAKNMEVHLWVNIFRILKNKNVPITKALGEKIYTRDSNKKSILNYPSDNLPDNSYWIDPGDLKAREYLVNLIKEMIDNYPQADGIHLDFVRYPVPTGAALGFGIESVSRFTAKTGIDPFRKNLSRKQLQIWDDWKRGQVTEFVRKMYPICKSKNTKLSAAVLCWPDKAYLSSFQDWRGWLQEGIVDFIATMNYSIDTKLVGYLSRSAICAKANSKVMVGLGQYLLTDTPAEMDKQAQDAIELGADGLVYFSYDSMKKTNFSKFKNIVKKRSK